ncbi:uncharacterized protein METZ01_LOCUS431828 [marine metagenome]|uniref:Uncharacterized protein n=1 Tax=marine metagenome TaxID=408172 RepID=A0A382Y6X2_9ZZZZ
MMIVGRDSKNNRIGSSVTLTRGR